MENDWDLQVVPIALRSPLPGMFQRLGSERILSNPSESLNLMKAIPSPLPDLSNSVDSLNRLKVIPSPLPALTNSFDSINRLKAIPNPLHALSNPVESLNSLKAILSPLPSLIRRVPENLDPSQKPTFCLVLAEELNEQFQLGIRNIFILTQFNSLTQSIPCSDL